MAILNESKFGGRGKREIDLSGPDGNAWALMGVASSFGKQLGWSKEDIGIMTKAMMAGDYENLLKVFDNHFGEIVDLVRSDANVAEDEDEEDARVW